MKEELPSVAVCIVTYNNEQDVSGLLSSLSDTDYAKDKIHLCLADNNSTDATSASLQKNLSKVPFLSSFVQNPENRGFDQANNQLVNNAMKDSPEYIVLLNPDTVVHKNWLKELIFLMKSYPNAGATQSLLLLKSDPLKINTKGNALYFLGLGTVTGMNMSAKKVYNQKIHEIGYSSGAAVCYRSSVLKQTGLFYPDFFYLEDLDLSWRMRLLGYESLLCPKSIVWHDYSFKKGAYKMKAIELNRHKALLQNYRLATLVVFLPALVLFELAVLVGSIKEKWYKEKLHNYRELFKSGRIIRQRRNIIQKNRTEKDRTILRSVTFTLQFPEKTPHAVRFFLNPVTRVYGWISKILIWW